MAEEYADGGFVNVMGTDIHAYIEYIGPWEAYQSLSKGEMNLARDDRLFHAIAFCADGNAGELPVSPRGFPDDCSEDVQDGFLVEADEYRGSFELVYEATGEALEKQIEADLPEWQRRIFRASHRVPNPDLHTASWLRLSEFEACVTKAGLTLESLRPDARAVAAAMRSLVSALGDDQVRLVYWFDG